MPKDRATFPLAAAPPSATPIAEVRMTISVQNRQRRVRYSLPWLRRFAEIALEPCEKTTDTPLAAEVEVTIVSDKTIARVHLDFMGLPEATDVITFHHGEIVASAETA